MKIALFGTSADPPTIAHRAILIWLAQQFDRVAVWASDNPFKQSHQSGGHAASLAHRQAMLKLLAAELHTTYPNVQLWEELSDRRSLISLQRAQQRWGTDADYGLVIGSDLIEQIPRWYEIRQLLQQVTLIIFARPGYPLTPERLSIIENLGGRYQLVSQNCLTATQTPAQISPLTPAVSSTDFRQSQDPRLIPDAIQTYIQQWHLYQCAPASPLRN